tara:strand:+ start:25 stop:414 length:390 start_codon:yes stop_codon:yes gene_type:complete
MLQVISIVLLVIGVPILIIGIFIISIRKIFEIEIIKKFLSRLSKRGENIDRIGKKFDNFILGFLLIFVIYVFSYPIWFILIMKEWIINKNTAEITSKEKINIIYIFSPLLLIWFAGFFYLLNYYCYGNY